MELQTLLLRCLPENTSGQQESYPRSECGAVIVVSYLSGVNMEITGYSGHWLTAADTSYAGCERTLWGSYGLRTSSATGPSVSGLYHLPAVALTKQPSNPPQYLTLRLKSGYDNRQFELTSTLKPLDCLLYFWTFLISSHLRETARPRVLINLIKYSTNERSR